MTTTIEMPNTLYRKIEKTAKDLDMDYEQFLVFVAENYLKEHHAKSDANAAIGMWADRIDMENPSEWLENKRSSRKNRLFGAS
jgi:hypothetical protein